MVKVLDPRSPLRRVEYIQEEISEFEEIIELGEDENDDEDFNDEGIESDDL